MAKTKIERITGIDEQIAQLENQRKKLMQSHKEEERKARTKRLIERGAIVESFISDADALTNEQVQSFLAKTIQTEFARKILNGLKLQNDEAATTNSAKTAQAVATSAPPKENSGTGQVV